MHRALAAFAAIAVFLAPAHARQAVPERPTSADLAKAAESLARSVAVVEYTLRYDKGDAPSASGAWSTGRDDPSHDSEWESFIREERPVERAGYFLAENRVITSDPMFHPRFVKEIAVRFGDQLVKATPVAYGRTQNALVLELEKPFTGAKPLTFDASRPGPYYAAANRLIDDTWSVHVGTPGSTVSVGKSGTRNAAASSALLLVDGAGTPVGMSMSGELGVDNAWKGSPTAWEFISEAEMTAHLERLEREASRGLLRVALRFRSPRSSGPDPYADYEDPSTSHDAMTEWNGTGVLVDDRTAVVIANFKPTLTARLNDIKVYADQFESAATFAGTLADYGVFLVTLEKPASGAIRFDTAPITSRKGELLLKAEVAVLGETRTAYYWRERLRSFTLGWRRQVSPTMDSAELGDRFLFTTDGALVAASIEKRQKVAVQDQESWRYRDDSSMLAVGYLSEAIKGGKARLDPENRPLSEDDENRLAWLGVELQPMDPDLARVNNVVDQTAGGQSGAMVTYVYADSPASAAGIEVGDILLRMHVQGQPKPLDVALEGMEGYEGLMDRIWEMLDQVPEEYFERLPKPWGSAENTLTRALTDIGFGTPFSADIYRNGALITRDLAVTESPAHFDSAKRFKSEDAGITVRDLTYEVRRYFQLKPDDAGVIISKVEKGGKGAVAGLKPYEIILSVNDTPIASSADFEKAISAGGELRLNVKRMTVGRIVKLKLDPAAPAGKAANDPQAPSDGAAENK